ncbi:Conserved_hypothetical protein [Hexamita inflata]|uniref:Lipid-binding serum glycoprotein N-terminal domain-containing protein n=1 Tax=Hexamita inflata TaxID=28002 RepID=A0AA86PU67_9EUKA|nr:Conserved hypothetical protein [Hexamita inflata]
MISVIFTLLTECGSPPYPRVLHPQDSAMSFTITAVGMKKFMECAMSEALAYTQLIPIPDLSFELDLGITRINFILSDIKFANLRVGNLNVDIPEGLPMSAGADDVDLELSLQWKFQQSSYPYLNDQGSGKVLLKGAAIRAVLEVNCDYVECPGHLKVVVHRADLTFDKLQILLEGGSSWIYQSLIDLVISAVESSLTDVISNVIIQSIIQIMNELMKSDGYFEPYQQYPNIIKDDRYTNGLVTHRGYMVVVFSGYVYSTANYSDEFITADKLIKRTDNLFNKQLTFEIAEAGFNNAFYIFHKYHDAYSKPGFKLTKAPTVTFYNVQAVLDVQIQTLDGQIFDLKLNGLTHIRQDTIKNKTGTATHNITQIFFQFQIYEGQFEGANEVLEHINLQMQHANYQIANTPFMELDKMDVVFDSKEKVLRIVGDNKENCKMT